ncbi:MULTISPECIES: carbohydrate kinase family protein [Subtercola]|uniref:Carbohydrate kinase n=1 Tax=Subtercola vilae TaxID=2056433 RepID=A0A4V4RGH1_9MICO|nr:MULTISPECIES: carbohydrate kinase [Subtercola]MEA9984665.1 carbohydrate kinase [Subtercola sp. RTI3]TIH35294.1 carbohydrate kinase [Subtercola vilae]
MTTSSPAPAADAASVVVVGEALTDIVQRQHEVTEHPGGSPMNVAIGLARLGDEVELVTRIGSDERGAALTSHIEESGVTFFPGSIVDEATSTGTAVLDETGAARYEFDIRWSLDFVDQLSPAALVHTGSIAAYLSPGAADVLRLLTATPASTIVTFDPNVRPSLLGTPDTERRTAENLMAVSNVVKLSDEDAEWLYPGVPQSEVLDHIRTFGPALAIMTRGASGALLSSSRANITVPGRTVVVADTIGAGDSFMSAVIHVLLRMLADGTTPESICDGSAFTLAALTDIGAFAVECAAVTVSRAGANPPHLTDVTG